MIAVIIDEAHGAREVYRSGPLAGWLVAAIKKLILAQPHAEAQLQRGEGVRMSLSAKGSDVRLDLTQTF